jgi:predicted metal-binding transcription factor (methanogenesis marker protein 9)
MAVDSTQTNTQQSAVNGDIDPKILEILGLQDVFDFDPDEYILLLKEKMAQGRMNNSSMRTEDVETITEEYKRVKKSKGSGKKLKVKKQTIKSDKFLKNKSLI